MATVLVRHNLPAEPDAFVGRESDAAELRELIRSSRAVTLCGTGGIGKTRLALRLAAELIDDFADGVWFVELAGADRPELVVPRIADAIGISEEQGRARLETLVEALRHQSVLIVLDNCEHLIEACAELGTALISASARLRLLTTSREPLRIAGEAVWRVPPLELPQGDDLQAIAGCEAVDLFTRRAAAAGPGFALTEANAAAVASLCRDLDGMPLAIELAAARVSVLSVGQIADRLANRFRLLTSGDRTAPARQRTLLATVDWSYELLDGPERILLRRFAVFAGGWTLEMAERICSDDRIPADQILDVLAALVDKSLVVLGREVAGELRYQLLETIRIYAAAKLTDAGEEEMIRRRHRDYLLARIVLFYRMILLEPAGFEERAELARRMAAEQDNFRSALAHCVAIGDATHGLRICYLLRPYWGYHGLFAEERGWLERLLALDPTRTTVPADVLGPSLVTYADAALELGDLAGVGPAAADGLALCRAVPDLSFSAHAEQTLGLLALFEGRDDEAETLLERALATAREAGDAYRQGLVAGSLGVLAAGRGRLRVAQRWYETALELVQAIDHQWVMAQTHLLLGDLAEQRGDLGEALLAYNRSLAVLVSYQSPMATLPALIGVGRVLLESGDLNGAGDRLREGLTIGSRIGNRGELARSLETYALLCMRREEPQKAVRLLGAAESLRESLGHLSPEGGEELLDEARSHLGQHVVAQLRAEGHAMTLDDAVDYAIEPWEEVKDLAVPPVESPLTAGPLTARETEIATLVARGLSNRAIAGELVISPATAARHIANILTKLGYGSRAQIAVWAGKQGLLTR